MNISGKSLQTGLYIGLVMLFVAMIGMLNVFSTRYIVADTLTLSTIMLVGVFLATGYVAAGQSGKGDPAGLGVHGALAGGIVALILSGLALIASQFDVRYVFVNVTPELATVLASGQESLVVGLLILVAAGAILGALGGLGRLLPPKPRDIGLYAVLMIVVIGMLQDQINTIIALPDALLITGLIAVGYGVALRRSRDRLQTRLLIAAAVGAALGLILALALIVGGASGAGTPQAFGGPLPPILRSFVAEKNAAGIIVLLALVGAALGVTGGAFSAATGGTHTGGVVIVAALLALGVLNSAGRMTVPVALASLVILIAARLLMTRTAAQASQAYETLKPAERRVSQTVITLAGLVFVLLIPQLLSNYINNVLDLVGLYVMMGLGLNIVVGFTGLLNLGFAAFFAIGAYTSGIVTTPNLLTCGGVSPASIPAQDIATVCTGVTTFWVGWLVAIVVTGLSGVLLGVPVLRLRGDYLAIVTLGFGEIIRLVTLSDTFKPYLGGAQGVANIPPVSINLSGLVAGMPPETLQALGPLGEFLRTPQHLTAPNQVYYIILIGILATLFVSYRLANSRLGRAWRAIREDEDVAQAMGVNLVRTKLLAMGIGTAFCGVGGAIFASYLRSIFPNSFTLLISINVLSLIIIGGLGSIPGVFVGALVIFGLPEALREFQEYRLLMFGALLVVTMLLRPSGIIPPATPRLEEQAEKALSQEGVKA